MKTALSLLYMCSFFSIVFSSLEDKIKSNWFEKNLGGRSGIPRCIEYDFISSMIFLKKQETIAAFSPFCSDINILIQCYEGDFGSKYILWGKDTLKFVISHTKFYLYDVYNGLTCIYHKRKILLDETPVDCFLFKALSIFFSENIDDGLYKHFTSSDPEDVFLEHTWWVKRELRGFFYTPLSASTFNHDHIYSSFIYFNDDWAIPFNENSYNFDFKLSDDCYIKRNFLNNKCVYKYSKINFNELEFQFVAIPYIETRNNNYTHYLAYLIPSNIDVNLSKLWDTFYMFSNGNIRVLIAEQNMKLIDLYIPELCDFQSNFDLKNLLYDLFKHNTAYNSVSTLSTFIEINKKNKKTAHAAFDDEVSRVIANKPHISFIFDMQFERILFLIKDNGKF